MHLRHKVLLLSTTAFHVMHLLWQKASYVLHIVMHIVMHIMNTPDLRVPNWRHPM